MKIEYPEKPFTTDDCSGFMSITWFIISGKQTPWEGCCIKHDKKYWFGGTKEDRKKADQELRKCVEENGHPIWAFIMYYSVRVGGHPYLPFPFRWNYGYKYPKGYKK